MEIYLINHTSPAISDDICFGSTDVALSDNFYNELKHITDQLPPHFDLVVSSPLKRCFNLALELETDELVKDDRLQDLDYGDWEMKKWSLIDQDLLNTWMTDFSDIAPKNGESFLKLNRRVEDFWEELLGADVEVVAIVTHANIIKSSLSILLDITLHKAYEFEIYYGGLSKFRITGSGMRIQYINR